MRLEGRAVHTVSVETPQEASEALEAADTLGLELREVRLRGRWTTRNGRGLSRGSTWSLYGKTRDAQKWFYLSGNRCNEVVARPREAHLKGTEDGSLELRFGTEGED